MLQGLKKPKMQAPAKKCLSKYEKNIASVLTPWKARSMVPGCDVVLIGSQACISYKLLHWDSVTQEVLVHFYLHWWWVPWYIVALYVDKTQWGSGLGLSLRCLAWRFFPFHNDKRLPVACALSTPSSIQSCWSGFLFIVIA